MIKIKQLGPVFLLPLQILFVGPVQAAGRIIHQGRIVAKTPNCCSNNSNPEEYANLMALRHHTNVNFFPIDAFLGVGLGKRPFSALSTTVSLLGGDLPMGSVKILRLIASMYDKDFKPSMGFSLLELSPIFFCVSTNARIKLPIHGHVTSSCNNDAMLFINVRLLDIFWDSFSQYIVSQWVKLGSGINFFSNGNGMAFLKRHLLLSVLMDVRTIFDNRRHLTNMDLGVWLALKGLFRTNDYAWQLEGEAQVRFPVSFTKAKPFLVGDIKINLGLFHNFLLTKKVAIKAGILLEAYKGERALAPPYFFAHQTQSMAALAMLAMGVRFGR